MRKLTLIATLLICSLAAYSQNIESVTSPSFTKKPKLLLVYVGVSAKKNYNFDILNDIRKNVPNDVFVRHTLVENPAWIESPKDMLIKASKQVSNEVDAVIVCSILEKNTQSDLFAPFGVSTKSRYEFKIQNPVTGEVLYRAVTEPSGYNFSAKRFIKKAIQDNVL